MKKETNNKIMDLNESKKNDKKYLKELQKFFDLTDNIQDEKLRKSIVYQMLKLEKILKNQK